MGGRRQKKMSLKRRQAGVIKNPLITLETLLDITKGYLEDLNTGIKISKFDYPICGKTIRMTRYKKLDEK
jgi:hypothetical protein